MTEGRPKGRASVMKGGNVAGEQYYVVHVRDLTGEHGSAAITGDQLRELIDDAEALLGGGSLCR